MADNEECEHAQLVADVRDALSAAIGKHEVGMMTRWVVVAETVTADGERGVWQLTDPDTKPWEVLGLLHHAIQIEQAAAVRGDD